ncbi:hypothetical protein KP004_17125 [Geomonas oryzisoli]|uniref:Uncharacterized protein n=1 Tax=Geomonas oryzisoli TaxID=2847992 RepID=A0ABX8J844_9BACT|nr:hypothetical protein [Geomonas oryzisoli]QWV92877.1 hypothetical protein KP004_17125 [Geomonas oryzisoli]
MKKTLLLMLVPVVLLVAGAFAVWGDEQTPVQPKCGNCAKMQQAQQQAPCDNCPKKDAAAQPNCDKCAKGAAVPCDNCPKKDAATQPACDKCQKLKGAQAAPVAGCAKCAKLQQDQAPADQPVQKECCKKQKVM